MVQEEADSSDPSGIFLRAGDSSVGEIPPELRIDEKKNQGSQAQEETGSETSENQIQFL